MILYANGCSWTWGGSLDHLFAPTPGFMDNTKRLEICWPHHLGKILESDEVINLSDGCGSNQRIVRTTFDWLKSFDPNKLKDVVAVIQITEWSRFEMYCPPDFSTDWENHSGDWIKCKVDVVNTESGYTPRLSQKELSSLLKEVQKRAMSTHHVEDFYRTLGYLYALKGIFDAFKIKDFYIWHQSHLWHQWPPEYRNLLSKHFKILDNDEDTAKWIYERVSDTDFHPGVKGHKQLASIIYDRMLRYGFVDK